MVANHLILMVVGQFHCKGVRSAESAKPVVLRGDIEKLLAVFGVLRVLGFAAEPSRFLTVLICSR